MPVYQMTYKNGCQQFMEMDTDESIALSKLMREVHFDRRGLPPANPVYEASTGATVDVITSRASNTTSPPSTPSGPTKTAAPLNSTTPWTTPSTPPSTP